MQLTEITYHDARPVDGYGPGFFRVAGQVIEGAMLITSSSTRSWGGLADVAPLLALAGEIDVVLLGTGAAIALPSRDLREAIEATGMGIEPMASPAACRTFNVLLAEGRRVALAALPV